MNGQIEAAQLTRRAFVYVRQSSMAQVLHHQESAMMQYDVDFQEYGTRRVQKHGTPGCRPLT